MFTECVLNEVTPDLCIVHTGLLAHRLPRGTALHTYRHGVLHVSHGRGELAEVQLGAVDQRVDQIPALPASLHTGYLPLGTVGEHGCMVLPCGNALGKEHKRSNHARKDGREIHTAKVEP